MCEIMTSKQKPRKLPTNCKICGDEALYSYFGVIVCSSCRIFFRRNALKKQDGLKCHDEGHCEINVHTRYYCTYCRLTKCFANGMQARMIRATRTKKNKNSQKLSSKISGKKKASKSIEQRSNMSVGNILDQSILSNEQWNLLSNINQYYSDESNGCIHVHQYLQKQNELPPKMRHKTESIIELFKKLASTTRGLYEKNLDFVSLCSHDRSLLIQKTMKYVTSFNICFILHYSQIIDDTTLYKLNEIIDKSRLLICSYRTIKELELDVILIKLLLTLLTFSIFDSISYPNVVTTNSLDMKSILSIQGKYTNLIWRYLLHRYDYERAVIYFSNLTRYFLSLQNILSDEIECEEYIV